MWSWLVQLPAYLDRGLAGAFLVRPYHVPHTLPVENGALELIKHEAPILVFSTLCTLSASSI